jgi:XRE family transcriptional regulator, aerobic/anaerobic benzoate catabolism transcriptional regulator
MSRATLLATVGARIRSRREAAGLSRRQLAATANLSERFLAQLEGGQGNISLGRFADVAAALGATPADLLAGLGDARPEVIALLGLRGAGKSTVGRALAARRGVPFVELDQRIEEAAGMPLGALFELHGEAHYRRLEREVLAALFAAPRAMVLATGGSLVTSPDTYALLRRHARTVWLRARPEDHWDRVVAQGDQRPMAEKPHAFGELRALLAAREPLYAAADQVVDTSTQDVEAVVTAIDGGA